MNLLKTLIATTHFEQARPLWQNNLAPAVFEPFFACMLISLSQHKELVWYETFITRSKEAAQASLQTGGFAEDLDLYWRKAHLTLKEQLIQSTPADDALLTQALPLAVHTAWNKLDELSTAQEQSIEEFVKQYLPQALSALPAWAEVVIDEKVLAELTVEQQLLGALVDDLEASTSSDTDPNPQAQDTVNYQDQKSDLAIDKTAHFADNESEDEDDDDDDDEYTERSYLLPLGIGVLLLALVGGGAYWYPNKEPPAEPSTAPSAPSLVAQSRPPSMLSVSIGSQGELYACHARLGNKALSDQLIGVLGANFGSTNCVMDISEQVSQTMLGMDKLTSVLALLKTVPFATLEMTGNEVYIHSPDPAATARLVADIGAVFTGTKVAAMPALDTNAFIKQSLIDASNALSALPDGANPYELAAALSLQKIDTQSGTIPEINRAVLALSAGKIATSPNARLIIVVHSDETGDKATARLATQSLANTIKAELIAQGANATQLIAQGVGYDFPIFENQTELGRFKNRRVEFLVYDDVILQALAPTAPPAIVSNEPTPTYTVVDGQIVDASTLPAMPAQPIDIPQEIATATPVQEMPSPTFVPSPGEVIVPNAALNGEMGAITITRPDGDNTPLEVPTIAPTAPLPQPKPSPIPDDLIKQVGSELGSETHSTQIVEPGE